MDQAAFRAFKMGFCEGVGDSTEFEWRGCGEGRGGHCDFVSLDGMDGWKGRA